MVRQLFRDFISLFYPEVCLCCGESLVAQEEFVCTMCVYKLPKTNFHTRHDNKLSNIFLGRAEVSAASAWCYYQKGNAVQDLVHELKYKGKKELGLSIGKWYGQDLKQSPLYEKVEVVVPVPLHKKKLMRRGYNQSAFFAKGLAESMKIVCLEDGLERTKNTETQTNKSRYSRWENVKDIFSANKVEELKGKHVLLVDDIVTTGATIEACVHTLRAIPVASVRIASIGYTEVA